MRPKNKISVGGKVDPANFCARTLKNCENFQIALQKIDSKVAIMVRLNRIEPRPKRASAQIRREKLKRTTTVL